MREKASEQTNELDIKKLREKNKDKVININSKLFIYCKEFIHIYEYYCKCGFY